MPRPKDPTLYKTPEEQRSELEHATKLRAWEEVNGGWVCCLGKKSGPASDKLRAAYDPRDHLWTLTFRSWIVFGSAKQAFQELRNKITGDVRILTKISGPLTNRRAPSILLKDLIETAREELDHWRSSTDKEQDRDYYLGAETAILDFIRALGINVKAKRHEQESETDSPSNS